MAAWPTYVDILWGDYEPEIGPRVRRTEFDSGEVAQKTYETRRTIVREFSVAVPLTERANFETWVNEHGSSFFDFFDWWTGDTLQLRIAGGRVVLSPGEGRREGERYMTARVRLEGYA